MSRFAPRLARALLGVALAAAGPALADDTLATSLIALRGEVEQLNQQLNLAREEQRTTLQGLAAQKAELEASLRRQEIQTRELEQKLAENAGESAQAAGAEDALKPVLLAAIEALRAQIAAALPFKTEERLAALAEIRAAIENGSLPSTRAANRLWAFVEDELRLTRETGLHQQTIRLGEESVLADVAKVGSVMLFWRTADGRVGAARHAAAGWRFEPLEADADRTRVLALFDALDKQIRQGWFELPNTLAASGG